MHELLKFVVLNLSFLIFWWCRGTAGFPVHCSIAHIYYDLVGGDRRGRSNEGTIFSPTNQCGSLLSVIRSADKGMNSEI